MISFILPKNLYSLKLSTMSLNLPIISRNNLDSCVRSQTLKRLIGGGKPTGFFQNCSKALHPSNNTPFHPTPKTPSSPTANQPSSSSSVDPLQIDSKLPENVSQSYDTKDTVTSPNPTNSSTALTTGHKEQQGPENLSNIKNNPLSPSLDTGKKWGKDTANPSGPNTNSTNAPTDKKNQALHEESYGKLIRLLSSRNNTLDQDELFLLRSLDQELTNTPIYNNKATQLTLETFFAKYKFNHENIKTVIGPNLKIEDKAGLNLGLVDQSSFFSAIQTKLLLLSVSTNIESAIIVETPNKFLDHSKLAAKTLTFIEDSKRATGNSFCDLVLNGHYYDFKYSTDKSPSVGKNHILPIAAYNLHTINMYLHYLESHLRQQIKNNNHPKGLRDHYTTILQKFQEINNDKSLSELAKIKTFNEFTIRNLPNRPTNCYHSILHPIGNPSYSPNPNSEYSRVARDSNFPKKYPKPSEVAEANRNYTAKQTEETKELIHKRTNGAYGSPSSTSSSKGKDSYPDEVD